MVIDNTPLYDEIWNAVYSRLHFSPSSEYRGHSFEVPLPFQISGSYSVYAAEDMTEEQIGLLGRTFRSIFARITKPGRKIYALDWHHSAFLYDPGSISEQTDCTVKDARYPDGGYFAYFPAFYPDGDYYFFIEENFEFGYLGHPWRQEIWIFGSELMNEADKAYRSLGWKRLR